MINAYKYDERLLAIIDESVLEIEQEGANLAEENAKTDGLIISLAAWHWRTRDTMAAMPRAIRWNLNNLIFRRKQERAVNPNGLRNRRRDHFN